MPLSYSTQNTTFPFLLSQELCKEIPHSRPDHTIFIHIILPTGPKHGYYKAKITYRYSDYNTKNQV